MLINLTFIDSDDLMIIDTNHPYYYSVNEQIVIEGKRYRIKEVELNIDVNRDELLIVSLETINN